MSRQLEHRGTLADCKRALSEYMDIIMLAGRLRMMDSSTEAKLSTANYRSFVIAKLNDAHRHLKVEAIDQAGTDLAECEMLCVHFVDTAATGRIPKWRPIHVEFVKAYKYVARQEGDRFDLGLYVHQRTEALRRDSQALHDKPSEILRIYHYCFELGYEGGYQRAGDHLESGNYSLKDLAALRGDYFDNKPGDLSELRQNILQELRRRQDSERSLPIGADSLISPQLPKPRPRSHTTMALSTMAVLGTALAFLSIGIVAAKVTLWTKQATVSKKLSQFLTVVEEKSAQIESKLNESGSLSR